MRALNLRLKWLCIVFFIYFSFIFAIWRPQKMLVVKKTIFFCFFSVECLFETLKKCKFAPLKTDVVLESETFSKF